MKNITENSTYNNNASLSAEKYRKLHYNRTRKVLKYRRPKVGSCGTNVSTLIEVMPITAGVLRQLLSSGLLHFY